MPARSNYAANTSPIFNVLSPDQCEEILLAAEEVLERTGVMVHDEEAREIMKKAGCWVDGARVRIAAFAGYPLGRLGASQVLLISFSGGRQSPTEAKNLLKGSARGFGVELRSQELVEGIIVQDTASSTSGGIRAATSG